jgi:hypothetical protein
MAKISIPCKLILLILIPILSFSDVYAECYQTIYGNAEITTKAGEEVIKIRVDHLCNNSDYGEYIMNYSKRVLPIIANYTKTPPNQDVLRINVTTYEPEGHDAYNYGDGNISIKEGLKSHRLDYNIIHELAHEWAIFNSQWLKEGTSDLIYFNVMKAIDQLISNVFYVENLRVLNESIENDTLLMFCDSESRCFSNKTISNFSYAKAFIFLKKIEDDFGYAVIEKLFEEVNLNGQTYWNSANFQSFLEDNTDNSSREIGLYFNGWVSGNTEYYSYGGRDVGSEFIIKKIAEKWNTEHKEIWEKGRDTLAQAISYTNSGEYESARKLYSESWPYLIQVYDPVSKDLYSRKVKENNALWEEEKKAQKEDEAKKEERIWKIQVVLGFLLFLILLIFSFKKSKARPFFLFYLGYVFLYFGRHTGLSFLLNGGYILLLVGVILLIRMLKNFKVQK